MGRTKKIIMGVTIASTIITAFFLICLLFDISLLESARTRLLLIFGSLAVGGFFAINSLNMIPKNKIIGWVSLALIAVAVLLIIIVTLAGSTDGIMIKITIAFGILSVVFDLIASIGLDLGKKLLWFQIIIYALAVLLDVIGTLALFGALPKGNGTGTLWFVTFLIIEIVLIVILKVISKKSTTPQAPEGMVTISKEEYDELQRKAKLYDEMQKGAGGGEK